MRSESSWIDLPGLGLRMLLKNVSSGSPAWAASSPRSLTVSISLGASARISWTTPWNALSDLARVASNGNSSVFSWRYIQGENWTTRQVKGRSGLGPCGGSAMSPRYQSPDSARPFRTSVKVGLRGLCSHACSIRLFSSASRSASILRRLVLPVPQRPKIPTTNGALRRSYRTRLSMMSR